MASAFKAGATALISGGASGIGFAFARICRTKYSMNVALIDNNSENLSKAKSALSALSQNNEKTETYHMDVSQLDEWKKVKEDFQSKFGGKLEVLMLNAGTAVKPPEGSKIWEHPETFRKQYDINVFGVLNGIATFLPILQSSPGPSTIVITGSKQGITNPPGGGVPQYNSSKATVKSIAEHLSYDLKTSHPNIKVHLLVPGWVFTGLSGNPGPVEDAEALKKKPKGAWLPSTTAEFAFKKIQEDKFYIICPDDDVSEALDQARMTWAMGDVTEGRAGLSRWDEKWKDQAAKWIQEDAERRAKKA